MRPSFRTLTFLSAAALCATGAFAANVARVTIPFDFTAKGQSYPAGLYDVSLASSHTVVTLQNHADASKQISWVVLPTEELNKPAVIKFNVRGAEYALKTIQVEDKVTPNLDTEKHAEPGVSATTSIGGQ